jgi:hypothetical protein
MDSTAVREIRLQINRLRELTNLFEVQVEKKTEYMLHVITQNKKYIEEYDELYGGDNERE